MRTAEFWGCGKIGSAVESANRGRDRSRAAVSEYYYPPRMRYRGPCQKSSLARDVPWKTLVTRTKSKTILEGSKSLWRLAEAKEPLLAFRPTQAVKLSGLSDRLSGLGLLDITVVAAPLKLDAVSLDHAVERLAIDTQQARCGLFVAAGMMQHARDITSFNF